MIDMAELLRVLADRRPIFHSEADFQHALAWDIHQRLANASIRLELPVAHLYKLLHVDVWVAQSNGLLASELKYKTRAISVRTGNEHFQLTDHVAQPTGRYDFIKDVQRLEQIASSRSNFTGYAILLTNDSAYWTRQSGRAPVDESFRLNEGRTLQGTLDWGPNVSAGTKRSRNDPLKLSGSYLLNWKDYSRLSVPYYGQFRYLMVKVEY